MNMTCNICGNVGEAEIKNGKYVCKTCGCVIGDAPAPESTKAAPAPDGVTVDTIECPICKNKNGNTVKDGKCKCALCGTEFKPQTNDKSTTSSSGAANSGAKANGDDEFTKEKNKNIIIGVVLLFLFWPASIYFFYKAYKMSK